MSKLKLVDPQQMGFKPASLDTKREYNFHQRAPIKTAFVMSLPLSFIITHLLLTLIDKADRLISGVLIWVPVFLTMFAIFYFARQESIKINQQGVFWLKNRKASKTLKWEDIQKIHVLIDGQYNMPSIIYQSGKTVAHLPNMNWKCQQHPNFSLLDVISSFRPDMQSISAREAMVLQQGGDIGEHAGKMTIVAVVGILMGALLVSFDPYATMELGGFAYLNMVFAALGFAWAWWMIKSPINMIGAKVIIAMLCAGGVYFAGSQLTLVLISQVMPSTPITFTMHSKVTREDREFWQSTSGLRMDCVLTPRAVGSAKVAQVIQLGGLYRLKFTDVCIPASQLHSQAGEDFNRVESSKGSSDASVEEKKGHD